MNVWLVMVGGRVNSAWNTPAGAGRHRDWLIEVNGDQIAVRVAEIEVRS